MQIQETIQNFEFEPSLDQFKLHKFLWSIRERYDLGFDDDCFESHAANKNRCDSFQNWFMHRCKNPKCNHKHRTKMICSSFFCPDCHEHYTKKLRISMSDYLIDCNHRLGVFTTPPEVWNKISWDNMNQLYDVVRETLQEYYKYEAEVNGRYYGQRPRVGMMAFLHTYGSVDLGWKPHINVFISTVGFIKCSKKYHMYNQFSNPGSYKDCKNEYHPVSTTFINYKKVRQIYQRRLKEVFDLEKSFSPQIRFDENVSTEDDMFDIAEDCVKAKEQHKIAKGVPIKELLKNMVDYFRRIPFDGQDVTMINNRYVGFTTYKRRALKLSWMFLDHKTFYYFIDQHIPKQNFRNMRLWDAYHYQSKIRKLRSQKRLDPELKTVKCPSCKSALILKDHGFACTKCDRLVPFSYYTVSFNLNLDPEGELLCPKCNSDMELILGVIGNRIAYLSNNILDFGRDFSCLKIGDNVPDHLLPVVGKGGMPYG